MHLMNIASLPSEKKNIFEDFMILFEFLRILLECVKTLKRDFFVDFSKVSVDFVPRTPPLLLS